MFLITQRSLGEQLSQPPKVRHPAKRVARSQREKMSLRKKDEMRKCEKKHTERRAVDSRGGRM